MELLIKDRKCNLTEDLLEKSKLDQHDHKAGHKVCLKEANVLQIVPRSTVAGHVVLVDHPFSLPRSDISIVFLRVLEQHKGNLASNGQ
jgi:hypothetical protein